MSRPRSRTSSTPATPWWRATPRSARCCSNAPTWCPTRALSGSGCGCRSTTSTASRPGSTPACARAISAIPAAAHARGVSADGGGHDAAAGFRASRSGQLPAFRDQVLHLGVREGALAPRPDPERADDRLATEDGHDHGAAEAGGTRARTNIAARVGLDVAGVDGSPALDREPRHALADGNRRDGGEHAGRKTSRCRREMEQTILLQKVDRAGVGAKAPHDRGQGLIQARRLWLVGSNVHRRHAPGLTILGPGHGIAHALVEMGEKDRIVKQLRAMPEAGIPGPAAVNLPAPRNRMIRAHLAALVGALVETRDHRRLAARAARVIVELIGDPPGDRGGGAERTREAHDAGLQAGRMALELRPEELPVPGPVVSGVGRRMDAEVTAARFDESLEGPLLRAVEDIAGRVDEAHRLEARESVGPVDRDAVTRREVADCGDRGRDRIVAVA